MRARLAKAERLCSRPIAGVGWQVRLMITSRNLVACVALLVTASPSDAAPGIRWTLEHFALGKRAIVLSDEKEPVALMSGWQCEVGELSDGSWYQARTTTCTKNDEQFSFVVQCDHNKPKDHVQIQLKSAGKPDYIEVSCEPR